MTIYIYKDYIYCIYRYIERLFASRPVNTYISSAHDIVRHARSTMLVEVFYDTYIAATGV